MTNTQNYNYQQMIDKLGIKDSLTARKIIIEIVAIALERIAYASDVLIPEDKKAGIDELIAGDTPTEEIIDQVQKAIPEYDELLKATVSDVVDELAENQDKIMAMSKEDEA